MQRALIATNVRIHFGTWVNWQLGNSSFNYFILILFVSTYCQILGKSHGNLLNSLNVLGDFMDHYFQLFQWFHEKMSVLIKKFGDYKLSSSF